MWPLLHLSLYTKEDETTNIRMVLTQNSMRVAKCNKKGTKNLLRVLQYARILYAKMLSQFDVQKEINGCALSAKSYCST